MADGRRKKQAERERTGTNGTVKRMETYERKKQYHRYLNPARLKKPNVTNQKGFENDIFKIFSRAQLLKVPSGQLITILAKIELTRTFFI